jgi:hypothetical protein
MSHHDRSLTSAGNHYANQQKYDMARGLLRPKQETSTFFNDASTNAQQAFSIQSIPCQEESQIA